MSGFAALNHQTALPVIDHRSKIVSAFAENQRLASEVDVFLQQYPDTIPLFQDIASYISTIKESRPPRSQGVPSQASKKRKLDGSAGGVNNAASGVWADRSTRADFVVPDLSFSVPQRKKLRLECVGSKSGGLRAVNAEGDIEFGIAWQDIDQAFCLPVPEKAKKQHNFVVMPKGGNGLSIAPNPPECIVWTVNESAASEDGKTDAEPANTARFLTAQLAKFGKEVVFPEENEFISAMPNIRKGEKAYHVKAHRGSKDGYLFFLPCGILWAFKKPLLFLPFSAIMSISYTSVLQRTFNLNVVATFTGPDGSRDQEIELSMIDQADYAGIDAYVKRHGLNDASLAAERRAKVYNVNKPKGEVESNGHANAAGAQGEEGESELQKAERLLQDEEDEMEEDYVDEESEAGSSEEEDYGEETLYEHGEGNEEGEGAFEEVEEYQEEEGGYEDEEG